jgi:hypothetical protein
MSNNGIESLEPISTYDDVKEIDAKKHVNDWAGKSDINDPKPDFDIISEEQEGKPTI